MSSSSEEATRLLLAAGSDVNSRNEVNCGLCFLCALVYYGLMI
jgi:hypothetical protein